MQIGQHMQNVRMNTMDAATNIELNIKPDADRNRISKLIIKIADKVFSFFSANYAEKRAEMVSDKQVRVYHANRIIEFGGERNNKHINLLAQIKTLGKDRPAGEMLEVINAKGVARESAAVLAEIKTLGEDRTAGEMLEEIRNANAKAAVLAEIKTLGEDRTAGEMLEVANAKGVSRESAAVLAEIKTLGEDRPAAEILEEIHTANAKAAVLEEIKTLGEDRPAAEILEEIRTANEAAELPVGVADDHVAADVVEADDRGVARRIFDAVTLGFFRAV